MVRVEDSVRLYVEMGCVETLCYLRDGKWIPVDTAPPDSPPDEQGADD